MKKLLFISIFLLSSMVSNASHIVGGTITWKCLSSGEYEFYLEAYLDCTGIPWVFENEILDIAGSPLPTNGITTIDVFPDSAKWLNSNRGDLSPICNSTGGNSYSCSNQNPGTIQAFYYSSNAITLTGSPPSTGWGIYWKAPCCWAGDMDNLITTGNVLLKATMFNSQGANSMSPCFDSSPEFAVAPNAIFCSGRKANGSFLAIDHDLDSIIYSLDTPLTGIAQLPYRVPYVFGYSAASPTPDQSFNAQNQAYALNQDNGAYQFLVNSSMNHPKYYVVERVDAYKNGNLSSSNFRGFPISIVDCGLPGSSLPPEIFINGSNTSNYTIEVEAGTNLSIPISANDGNSSTLQSLTLIPEGVAFSQNRLTSSPCNIAGIEPCAVLRNTDASIDNSYSPPLYTIRSLDSLETSFIWNTDCNHLGANNEERSYYFQFKVRNDDCPIPLSSIATIKVTVKPQSSIKPPVLKGISVDLNGEVSYQWVPSIDSLNGFDNHQSSFSRTVNNQSPALWSAVDNNITFFQQDAIASNIKVYQPINPLNPSSGNNILNPIGNSNNLNFNYYLRMRTSTECSVMDFSEWSENSKIIKVNASPGSNIPGLERSIIQLDWNPSQNTSGGLSRPYFVYESATKYYVQENKQVTSVGINDPNNWKVIEETYNNNIAVASSRCDSGFIAYRVEARDTVITYSKGFGLLSNEFDTLVFSTFSMVDSIYTFPGYTEIRNNAFHSLESTVVGTSYKWIDCSANLEIPGEVSKSFVPRTQGSYRVVVNKGSNCIDTSACFTTRVLNDSVVLFGTDSLVSSENNGHYQWINCYDNLPIQGATDKTFLVSDTGFYAVVVSAYGYSDTSKCVPVFAISLPENSFQETFTYYPNPTRGTLFINSDKTHRNLNLIVRNIHGQVVQRNNYFNQNSIELEIEGKAGIYFIEVLNELGEKANLKVIKQ